MIHWCLSDLALKVEKCFDDGGLQLTDKSRPEAASCVSLSASLVCPHLYGLGDGSAFPPVHTNRPINPSGRHNLSLRQHRCSVLRRIFQHASLSRLVL